MADFVTATRRQKQLACQGAKMGFKWMGAKELRFAATKERKEESINFVVRLTVPVAIVLFSIWWHEIDGFGLEMYLD